MTQAQIIRALPYGQTLNSKLTEDSMKALSLVKGPEFEVVV
jgi:hypothetical protein